MTTTHTIAELRLTPAAYDEVKRAFEAAGYQHAFMADGMIDMSGVGVTRAVRPAIMAEERTVTTGADGGETTRVRRSGADFTPPHWTELFESSEAYMAWRETQGADHPSLVREA